MDEKPYPRIVLAMPCERVMYTEAAHAMMAIVHQGFPFMAHGYSRLDRTRNDFAIELLKSDFTHVLMLDSDHLHPADIVQQLGKHVARDPSILVVGGLNFRRGEPYDPCAYLWSEDHHLQPMERWPDDALLKVDVLGSGSILIAREVFERLPFPWFGYNYEHNLTMEWSPDNPDGIKQNMQWPGTDIWFSELCNKHGIDQWVYTGVSSPHLIHTTVTSYVREAFMAKARQYGKIETVGRPTQVKMSEDNEWHESQERDGCPAQSAEPSPSVVSQLAS